MWITGAVVTDAAFVDDVYPNKMIYVPDLNRDVESISGHVDALQTSCDVFSSSLSSLEDWVKSGLNY